VAEATGGHVRSGSVRICSSARLASVRVAHVKTKGWLATQAPNDRATPCRNSMRGSLFAKPCSAALP